MVSSVFLGLVYIENVSWENIRINISTRLGYMQKNLQYIDSDYLCSDRRRRTFWRLFVLQWEKMYLLTCVGGGLKSACTSVQFDQSSLSAWRTFPSLATQNAPSEDSNQAVQMQWSESCWVHIRSFSDVGTHFLLTNAALFVFWVNSNIHHNLFITLLLGSNAYTMLVKQLCNIKTNI